MLDLTSHTPRPPNPDLAATDYIAPNFFHALRFWWAYYWRTRFLSSIVLFFFVGATVHMETRSIIAHCFAAISQLVGVVLTFVAGIVVMQFVLRKQFRGFRIALRTSEPSAPHLPLEISDKRAVRVWWAYAWREFAFPLVVRAAIVYPLTALVSMITRDVSTQSTFEGTVSLLFGAAVGIYLIHHYILDEDISDFHVALVPPEPILRPAELSPDAAPKL